MKQRITNLTIGADVELFFQNLENGEFVSAEGYVKGSKHNPFNFDESHKYFIISLDNVAVEFGIPPVRTPEDWENFLMRGVEYANSIAPKDTCTVPVPAAIFSDNYLQTENAQRFGCDPDLCVWTRSPNTPPEAKEKNLRSAGGHIHIGYDVPEDGEMYVATVEDVVKAMDLYIGVPSVIQEPDNKRKELYGKAGCFRFKEYGLEYRTVSNYYMATPNLRRWVYDNTNLAVDYVNGVDNFDLDINDCEEIQSAINSSDKKLAEQLIKRYNIPVL